MAGNDDPGAVTARTRATLGSPRWLVAGVLVVALGAAFVLVLPPGRQHGVFPGAETSAAPPTATPAAESTSLSGLETPTGLVAIGHAALLGTNSDPSRAPGHPVPDNSWVSGTGPNVDSIYERLVAVLPATEGLISNQGGQVYAQSSSLTGQARAALAKVPTPALVIVQTIDNDVRCDGTDGEHVPVFGEAVADALEAITSASPGTRILMVGARPIEPWVQFLQANPDKATIPQGHSRTDWIGTGMCDVLDPDGNVVPEHVEMLSAIYDAYEAEQERVCALEPQCRTDGDVEDSYVYDAADWSDWAYLSILGNATMADRYWPLIAETLELGTDVPPTD